MQSATYPYWHFLPATYNQNPQSWPLILFLHGAGERGTALHLVTRHGPPNIVQHKPDFPFIVIAPQCPTSETWSAKHLLQFLDTVTPEYHIDTDRIYLTGISMGGGGAWSLASLSPERFAALVPICGYGNPSIATRLRNLPTWVFHGARDQVVPLESSAQLVQALQKAGGNVIFTVYPDADHAGAWIRAYNDDQLYTWLLQHRLSTREVST